MNEPQTSTQAVRRLKFVDFAFDRKPNGGCRASVSLEDPEGRSHVATHEAVGGAPSQLRCAADATLDALTRALHGSGTFELIGVKGIRAFDMTVIIVAISAHRNDETRRLVGAYLAEESPERGAALAVLNATNRFLGNAIFAR